MKFFFMVFVSVFIAELGDKTQIATFLFAADPGRNRFAVFLPASLALLTSSFIAVALGAQVARYISPLVLKNAAGAGFILIGIWLLVSARSG